MNPNRLRVSLLYGLVITLILSLSLSAFAQSIPPTNLEPGEEISGAVTDDQLASTFTFSGDEGAVISLLLNSDDEPALTLLLTDMAGALVAQTATENGSASLSDVTLETAGIYVVTVVSSTNAAEFTLLLQTEDTEAATAEPEETETVDVVEATPTPTIQPEAVIDETPEPDAMWQPSTDILLANGIEVELRWSAPVDMNLEVRDPLGNSLFWNNRETLGGVGSFGFDANGLCGVISEEPVETASWASTFLPTGSYEILVFYREECEDTGPVPFTVTVTVDGVTQPTIEGALNPPLNQNTDSVYIANFVVAEDGTATLNNGGVYPDTSLNIVAAPFADLQAEAEPISLGDTVSGTIFEEQDYQVYSFDAAANDVVTIDAQRTNGSLDTLLQLVGPNGTLIQVNDDRGDGTTNSLISNATLVNPGTYYIVATRYGKDLGGTEGEYELTLSGTETVVSPLLEGLNFPQGDIAVSLVWETNADVQLLVRDPLGDPVFDDNPQSDTGGILEADGNVNCTVADTTPPASYVYWPFGLARPGIYEIEVWYQNTCDDPAPVDANLAITVDNNVVFGTTQRITEGQRYVVAFSLNPDRTVTVGQGGFVGNEIALLDVESIREDAQPISINQSASGTISIDNPYDLYAFQGTAGDVVTIGMAANSQTLDTKLLVVGPTGGVVAENDDIEAALASDNQRRTDSLINAFTLPQSGTYVIVATRYAFTYGGTIGGYSLSVVGSAP